MIAIITCYEMDLLYTQLSPPGWEAPRGQSSLGAKTHFHICISHKEKFEMNGQMKSYVSTKADHESLPVLGEQRCG